MFVCGFSLFEFGFVFIFVCVFVCLLILFFLLKYEIQLLISRGIKSVAKLGLTRRDLEAQIYTCSCVVTGIVRPPVLLPTEVERVAEV